MSQGTCAQSPPCPPSEAESQPSAESAEASLEPGAASAEPAPSEDASAAQPDLEAELAKFKDLALRAHAELDNFRKRAAREREEAIRFANARLLESLLPVLDSFDLGFQSAKASPEGAAIAAGFEMVRRQLGDWLRQAGVQIVEAQGQAFDPALHEAVGREPSAEAPEGVVIRQTRPGYILNGRLLRPASVIVSSGPADSPS